MESRHSKISFLLFSALLFVLVGWWVTKDDALPSGQQPEVATTTTEVDAGPELPSFLTTFFPDTNFSDADPSIYELVPGGPPKDGIPAIDNPRFVTMDSFEHDENTKAIVVTGEDVTKVYPYTILAWHQIVNDELEGEPVAVTFCPTSGNVSVFNRRLPGGLTSFGVTGGLIDDNMVMYDRATESLWQQSEGQALAGIYLKEVLATSSYQILPMSEAIEQYPEALLLSEETGFTRDYDRIPYTGF